MFKLIINSSDVGIGAMLIQEASDGLDHPVRYFFKEIRKISKKPFCGGNRNIELSFSLTSF